MSFFQKTKLNYYSLKSYNFQFFSKKLKYSHKIFLINKIIIKTKKVSKKHFPKKNFYS